MSILADMENEIVSTLQSLTYGAGPAFATVQGFMISRNETFPKTILSERMPAAYVGFRSLFFDNDLFTLVRFFSVYVAVRNMRRQADARHGADGRPGMFTVNQLVADALDGEPIAGSTSLIAGISTVSADTKTLVSRMSFGLYQSFFNAGITVDGNPLVDSASIATLSISSPHAKTGDDSLPGAPGLIRQLLGRAPREITVRGILRAPDDATLNAKETELEALAVSTGTHVMSDSANQTLDYCAGKSYERIGPRTRRWGSHPVTQEFIMRFQQLAY